MSGFCYRCGAAVGPVDRVGRRDVCADCGAELHCCCNCRHYAAEYHNQCREPQAERQVEKERSNFCDYFSLSDRGRANTAGGRAGNIRDTLDSLFRKRPRRGGD